MFFFLSLSLSLSLFSPFIFSSSPNSRRYFTPQRNTWQKKGFVHGVSFWPGVSLRCCCCTRRVDGCPTRVGALPPAKRRTGCISCPASFPYSFPSRPRFFFCDQKLLPTCFGLPFEQRNFFPSSFFFCTSWSNKTKQGKSLLGTAGLSILSSHFIGGHYSLPRCSLSFLVSRPFPSCFCGRRFKLSRVHFQLPPFFVEIPDLITWGLCTRLAFIRGRCVLFVCWYLCPLASTPISLIPPPPLDRTQYCLYTFFCPPKKTHPFF